MKYHRLAIVLIAILLIALFIIGFAKLHGDLQNIIAGQTPKTVSKTTAGLISHWSSLIVIIIAGAVWLHTVVFNAIYTIKNKPNLDNMKTVLSLAVAGLFIMTGLLTYSILHFGSNFSNWAVNTSSTQSVASIWLLVVGLCLDLAAIIGLAIIGRRLMTKKR